MRLLRIFAMVIVSGVLLAGCANATNVAASPDDCPDLCVDTPPNYRPIPNVVGMGVDAACAALKRSDYYGVVFADSEYGPDAEQGRVAEQDPKAGAKTFVDATVFIGVPDPMPHKLPPDTTCPKRKVLKGVPWENSEGEELPGAPNPS